MELQHFSHIHPLVLSEESSNESDKANCSGCGELVSGPTFSCRPCGFHLDKKCAEAPFELTHPFHRNHNLILQTSNPYIPRECVCDFCKKSCKNFFYHCSCQLDLHMICALFSYDNIAKRKIGELQIAHVDPLISTEAHSKELKKAKCFACLKPLLNSAYLSLDSGFYLHKKCVELPLEISHPWHHQHSLFLQFNSERLVCQICGKIQGRSLVYSCSGCQFALHIDCSTLPTQLDHLCYHKHPLSLQINNEGLPCQICLATISDQIAYCCSICKFCVHTECASPPPPIIRDKNHQHPFILLPRQHILYMCDACGTQGKYVSYICSTCGIVVHKNCISVPRIIKFYRHQHRIVHTYFLEEHEFETWECRFCHEEVKKEHGGYICSKCNYIVHVKCAIQYPDFYDEVDSAETVNEVRDLLENVAATSEKHFSHQHDLAFGEEIKNDKQCDGCGQFISTSYYHCSQCDFFLHKSCAKLPIEKHIWFHIHLNLHKLTSDGIFTCDACGYETNGFAYICGECGVNYCLRCATVSDMPKCQAHEHLLPYYRSLDGSCNACGVSLHQGYKCKTCEFYLHGNCLKLPLIARHKSDEHPLKLTYGDNSNYSECYHCDICEKERKPNHWFYSCEICNTSAHPNCVVRKSSFIKPGSISKKGDHPHPLTFVQKVHSYPECNRCRKPCFDLALECKDIECSYIVHWECMKKPPSV